MLYFKLICVLINCMFTMTICYVVNIVYGNYYRFIISLAIFFFLCIHFYNNIFHYIKALLILSHILEIINMYIFVYRERYT